MEALATRRFKLREPALTRNELITEFDIPAMLVDKLLNNLQQAKILTAVSQDSDGEISYQPACDPDDITVNMVNDALAAQGQNRFIEKADKRFDKLFAQINAQRLTQQQATKDISLLDLVAEFSE